MRVIILPCGMHRDLGEDCEMPDQYWKPVGPSNWYFQPSSGPTEC